MWTCAICKATTGDDDWEVCWKCGNPKAVNVELSDEAQRKYDERMKQMRSCLRCHHMMEYAGVRRFHEGSRVGIMGDLAELFLNRENLILYACRNCGKVEFYMDDIGADYRMDPFMDPPESR
ncbi:MAG: hypothetical protein P1U86_04975 [Verrucomicrobiales bacterium]|nr:hypothetical protein [Verrucomicrobiales bacterium]